MEVHGVFLGDFFEYRYVIRTEFVNSHGTHPEYSEIHELGSGVTLVVKASIEKSKRGGCINLRPGVDDES